MARDDVRFGAGDRASLGLPREKVLAAVESSNAMARRMIAFPAADPFAMWNAWARILASGMTPYRARAVRNARSARRAC